MPDQKQTDPYVYPNTNTLINKFNIRDQKKLQELEAVFFLSKKSEPLPAGNLNYEHLKAIHHHFFSDIYAWAGKERTINIAKGDSHFAHTQYISKELNKLFTQLGKDNFLQGTPKDAFCQKLSHYFNEINAAHPFREGNGRTQRAFCDLIAERSGYQLDWTSINKEKYVQANIAGFLKGDYSAMENIFRKITTPIEKSHDTLIKHAQYNKVSHDGPITPEKRAYYEARYIQMLKENESYSLNKVNSNKFEKDTVLSKQKNDKEIEI